MSPETYSELRWSFFRKSLRVSVVCFGKISVLDIKSISECTSQVNLDVQLLSISSPIFLTWIPIKHLKEIFFCRNGQWNSTASYFQGKVPSQMFDSFLNVFLNSIVMLLYYQYYYSCSFIYFVILSFPFFIILALMLSVSFLCYHLAFFLMLGYFATYFGQFFIFYQFFMSPFYKSCLVQTQFMHIFYSMLTDFKWFNVITIILMTYPW